MREPTEKDKKQYKETIEEIIDACIQGTDGLHGLLLVSNDIGMMTVLSINSTKQDAALLINAAHEAMKNPPENLGAYN
jgi:hypothetical protein